MRLSRDFFDRDSLGVARELLGKRLVRIYRGRRLSGIITEVEAYRGLEDAASHAHRGPTPRAGIMFGPPGHAYVYFIYGMYHCLNVVSEREGYPAAVLIRGLQPTEGMATMRRLRGGAQNGQLADGPGKLCQALAIDRRLNGLDLLTSQLLFIEGGISPERIASGPRVGVRGDALARKQPWRLWIDVGSQSNLT